ncbi:MAG: TlpA family protein disulfide reductase [Marinilabiliaceae bacterium]|nr:TlpA family protein disulfide reductase [Marinilabiliaceae bacterium]
MAELDSNSCFSIEIPLERMAKGRISVGQFYHDIYLMPGDDFSIRIDGDTINYSGKAAEKNNFLYASEVSGLWDRSFYHASNKGELTPVDFFDAMTAFKQKRIDFFDSYSKADQLQNAFVEFYKIETQVIFEQLIQDYPRRYAYKHKIHPDSLDLPIEFKAYNEFSNFVDDSKIVSSTYVHNLRNKLYSKAREITQADTTLKWKDAIYVALFDSLSGKSREYVLTKWIISEFSEDKYDTIAIDKFNTIEKGALAQSSFDQALMKYNEKRSLIGQPLHTEFASTQLTDTSGTALTFEAMMAQHKGHVVYLDLWAMSCGPCRAAMPYSKKLKEKLKEAPVDFVYISLDKVQESKWVPVFETTFTKDHHYVMENGFNSRLYKFMEINWVPCYMIFDKAGHLVDFNADRPSRRVECAETELEKTLKELAS